MSAVLTVPAAAVEVPDDPSTLGWPPTLPLELAMGDAPPKDICVSYGIDQTEWRRLIVDENFRRAVSEAVDELSKEGARFKVKLRAQAEGYLPQMWKMAHSDPEKVPPRVAADIMMFAVRAAGLDASIEQKAKASGSAGGQNNNLSITLVLD